MSVLADRPSGTARSRQPSRPAPVDAPRAAAFAVLQAVAEQDAYANLVLPRQLTEAGLTGRDAALATELGYGTLRASGTLDEVLRRCSSRELDEIQTAVLNLLRLGAYQLLRTRIPTPRGSMFLAEAHLGIASLSRPLADRRGASRRRRGSGRRDAQTSRAPTAPARPCRPPVTIRR